MYRGLLGTPFVLTRALDFEHSYFTEQVQALTKLQRSRQRLLALAQSIDREKLHVGT